MVGLCLFCACGRIGFDLEPRDGSPYTEPGGQPDPTFGSGGYTVTGNGVQNVALYDVIVRDAGGFLCIGPHTAAGAPRFGLFAFTSGGQLDATFGTGGIKDTGPSASGFGYGALRLDDGRVLVNGDGDDGSGTMDDIVVGIVDQAGTTDPAFAAAFRRFDVANTPDTSGRAAQVGSTAVICGTGGYSVADPRFVLVSIGLDGTPTSTFGSGGMVVTDFHPGVADGCSDVVTLPNGNVVAAGETANHALVASYRADGTRDPAFATDGFAEVGTPYAAALGIALAPSGDLVISGQTNNHGLVAMFAPDGTLHAGFGQGGLVELPDAEVLYGVAVQPNGKIIAIGRSTAQTAIIVRLTPDGTLDPSFATGGVYALPIAGTTSFQHAVFAPGGDIVAVGLVGSSSPYRGVIARLH